MEVHAWYTGGSKDERTIFDKRQKWNVATDDGQARAEEGLGKRVYGIGKIFCFPRPKGLTFNCQLGAEESAKGKESEFSL